MAEVPNAPTEDPQVISKNAKSSLTALKEALKTKDPFDRDVEFHRKAARRQHLHLIFSFPYTPQALALDNLMWLETTHQIIQAYREKLNSIDKSILKHAGKLNTTADAVKQTPIKERVATKEADYQRFLSRFRQFLAEEEKFWAAFALRFARSFALEDAKPYLEKLELSRYRDSSIRKTTFPEETNPAPPPVGQRQKKMGMLTRAVISLGDLARYKEMYNTPDGRPKSGPDQDPKASTEDPFKPSKYAHAIACYDQARLMFPNQGHASHQLAILSSYQGDPFESVFHYYRALTVKIPFTMAYDNLLKTLEKIYVAWKAEGGLDLDRRVRLERLNIRDLLMQVKKDFAILHALWRIDRVSDEDWIGHTNHAMCRFNLFVACRLLPIAFTSRIYIAAVSALHTYRFPTKDSTEKTSSITKDSKVPFSKQSDTFKEQAILTHVMDMHLTLVRIAVIQLTTENLVPGMPAQDKVTLLMRRLSHTLRLCSRWLASNLDYLYQVAAPDRILYPDLNRMLGEFWPEYAIFLTKLAKMFTAADMKLGTVGLEEEDEYRGFMPFRGTMVPVDGVRVKQQSYSDEFLRRLRHILVDGEIIIRSEYSPLSLMDGRVVSKTEFGSPIPFRDVMPADKTTHNTHSNEKTTKLLEIPGSRPTWLLVNNMNDPLDYTTKSSRLSTQPAKQPLTPAQRRAIGERNKAADDQARAAARVWNAIKGFPEFINYSPINLEMRAARLKAEAEAKQNEQADGKSTSTENPKPGDLGKKGEAGAMESALKLDLTPIPAAEDVMMVGQSKEVMVVPEANTPLQSPLLEETKARESHRFPKQLLEDRVRRASGQGAHLEETPRPMLETPAKLNGKRLGDGPKVPSTPRQNSNIETPRLPTEAPEPFHTHTFTDKSGNQEHSVDDTNKDEISSKGSSDQHSKSNDDDDIASVSTEDPVTMAIRATLTVSDEEDDGFEEGSIIYPRDSWTGLDELYSSLKSPSTTHVPGPLPPSAFRQVPSSLHEPIFSPASHASQNQTMVHQDVFGPANFVYRSPPLQQQPHVLSPPKDRPFPSSQNPSKRPPQQLSNTGTYPPEHLYPTNQQPLHQHGLPHPLRQQQPPLPHSSLVTHIPPSHHGQAYSRPLMYDTAAMAGPSQPASNGNTGSLSTGAAGHNSWDPVPQANPQQHRYRSSASFSNRGPISTPGTRYDGIRPLSMDIEPQTPQTAQDLLQRVLGSSSQTPTNPPNPFGPKPNLTHNPNFNQNLLPNFPNNVPKNRPPQRGPNIPPPPPLFGGQGGNSIWAP